MKCSIEVFRFARSVRLDAKHAVLDRTQWSDRLEKTSLLDPMPSTPMLPVHNPWSSDSSKTRNLILSIRSSRRPIFNLSNLACWTDHFEESVLLDASSRSDDKAWTEETARRRIWVRWQSTEPELGNIAQPWSQGKRRSCSDGGQPRKKMKPKRNLAHTARSQTQLSHIAAFHKNCDWPSVKTYINVFFFFFYQKRPI